VPDDLSKRTSNSRANAVLRLVPDRTETPPNDDLDAPTDSKVIPLPYDPDERLAFLYGEFSRWLLAPGPLGPIPPALQHDSENDLTPPQRGRKDFG